MGFTIRGPSGRLYEVPDQVAITTIRCENPSDAAGQWMIHSGSVLFAIRNGRGLDRLGDTLVFTSTLDEAGEEFIAVLERHRLCVVRLQLSTTKLSLPNYYEYLRRYRQLFGAVPPGPMTVAGTQSTDAASRLCIDSEYAFHIVGLAHDVLRACQEAKRDVSRHPRGRMGATGIDALATLRAWRESPSWYVKATCGQKRAISCGRGNYVVPLRAMPRISVGGNLFTASMASRIGQVIDKLPRTSGGLLASTLLHSAKSCMESADQTAMVNPAAVRTLLARPDLLPQRSALAVACLRKLEDASDAMWRIIASESAASPHMLPDTEIVFQRVAIAIILVALGVSASACDSALKEASMPSGLEIAGGFRAWYDTSSHGLNGWRQSSVLPSNYRPDLVVQRPVNNGWMLVDAKLRRGSSERPLLSQSAIKDMQAYMQEYGLRKALILAPSHDGKLWLKADLKGEGYHIRAIGVPAIEASYWDRQPVSEFLEDMWNL